jgi:steroid delta-isomerase-like uncharacterized protein
MVISFIILAVLSLSAATPSPSAWKAPGASLDFPKLESLMSRAETLALISRYYAAFNAADPEGMLTCLTEDIEHRVNEGGHRIGKAKFAEFCGHMGVSYREELKELVIFATDDGSRGAAEFVVHGTYLQTDPGLPEARGQSYILPAGGFFEVRDGKISRITTFYNLNDWIRQVSA